MVVLIFRCPIKSFMISIGTPALTRNVAAKWRNDLNEWPWYPALLQALSISVLIAFVLATWKNDWFFSIGQINKERTSFSFWHMGISTQYRLRPCFPWYPYPIRVFTSSMFSFIFIRNTLSRLGEAIYQTPEQFKAWSQNHGHEKVLTTFYSYGVV